MTNAERDAVLPIIGVRTAQVGGLATLVLFVLYKTLPRKRFWPLVPVGGLLVTAGLSAYFRAVFDPRTTFGFPLIAGNREGGKTQDPGYFALCWLNSRGNREGGKTQDSAKKREETSLTPFHTSVKDPTPRRRRSPNTQYPKPNTQYLPPSPPTLSRGYPPARWGGATPNTVFLTFDDGPHPETTPTILAMLARSGAKATFFLVAKQAQRYPEWVQRIASEGHTIGVHGLRHSAMVLHSAGRIRRELWECERIFARILGGPLPKKLFRPPHGFKTWTLSHTVHKEKWLTVAWSLDLRDYDRVPAETMCKQFQQARPGDVVLLHEMPDNPETWIALPRLLQDGQQRGFQFLGL